MLQQYSDCDDDDGHLRNASKKITNGREIKMQSHSNIINYQMKEMPNARNVCVHFIHLAAPCYGIDAMKGVQF